MVLIGIPRLPVAGRTTANKAFPGINAERDSANPVLREKILRMPHGTRSWSQRQTELRQTFVAEFIPPD